MHHFTLVSDLHYYSEKLGSTGKAYRLREGSDQKCLAESGSIISSAFEKIVSDGKSEAVIIPGDLTNDGEMFSHEEIRELLRSLNEKLPVYLTVATHDWCCDGTPRRYEGDNVYHDVQTLACENISEYYSEFGKNSIISEYVTERGLVSHCFQIEDGVRLLALNDDSNGEGSSGYSAEHLEWIVSCVKEAKKAGDVIFAVQHHLLVPGISMLINKGQIIGNHEKTADALADAGLRLIFTGHSHMLRNTEYISHSGNKITQINLGALTGYPAPITHLTVDGCHAVVETETLGSFTFNGKELGADFIRAHTENVLLRILRSAGTDREDFFEILGSNGIKTDKLKKIYPIIRRSANFALNVNVGMAARIINSLTLGKGVSRKAAAQIKSEKLIDNILPVFLAVFDGGMNKPEKNGAVYRIVCDAASLPSRILHALPVSAAKKESAGRIFNEINSIAHELIEPSGPNVLHTEVDLC